MYPAANNKLTAHHRQQQGARRNQPQTGATGNRPVKIYTYTERLQSIRTGLPEDHKSKMRWSKRFSDITMASNGFYYMSIEDNKPLFGCTVCGIGFCGYKIESPLEFHQKYRSECVMAKMEQAPDAPDFRPESSKSIELTFKQRLDSFKYVPEAQENRFNENWNARTLATNGFFYTGIEKTEQEGELPLFRCQYCKHGIKGVSTESPIDMHKNRPFRCPMVIYGDEVEFSKAESKWLQLEVSLKKDLDENQIELAKKLFHKHGGTVDIAVLINTVRFEFSPQGAHGRVQSGASQKKRSVSDHVAGQRPIADEVPGMKATLDEVPGMKATRDEVPGMKATRDEVPGMKATRYEVPGRKAARDEVPGRKLKPKDKDNTNGSDSAD